MDPYIAADLQYGNSGTRAYWLFQLVFWSVLLTPMVITIRLRPSALDLAWSIGNYALLFFATHILHVLAQRQRWLYLPPTKMVLRMAAAVLVLAVTYFVGAYFEKQYQGPSMRDFMQRPGIMLGYWLGSLMQACAWAGCYLAITEGQRRRGLEYLELRSQLAGQEAQLRNLRAQLNPHFLFNSLNTLRELIVENPDKAQDVITNLSVLLRYSLQSDSTELIDLSHELAAIEGYLAVEAARYEERLRVCWEIDPATARARVPPMLLQPLVENAVKHGVARNPTGGEVVIRATARDGHLCLEVLNSGELNGLSSEPGVGLKNARERLRLLYGARAHLTLEDTNAGSIRACVVLPLEPGTRKKIQGAA